MNYGDNFKVQCYSHDTCVEGNLTFVDTTAKAGHQYSYRLVYGDMVYDPDSGEYSVEIVSNIEAPLHPTHRPRHAGYDQHGAVLKNRP